MDTQLLTLSKIFTERLFRIPDYQRGYAWTSQQLQDFWDDISQLDGVRKHYTGVLTLEEVPDNVFMTWVEDLWIIKSKSYVPYYVVDGQQRLTTAIILIQTILNLNNENKKMNFTTPIDIQKKFIFDSKDEGISRSYIFGYEEDNPSYEYLKSEIFEEHSFTPSSQRTVYTHNLENAKSFFCELVSKLNHIDREILYKKISQDLLFNIFTISDEVDVCVAFETMNNRGKVLSDLELLKNRLIYLSLKFNSDEYEKNKLRRSINDCWKTIYHNLGRNKHNQLDDDTFLSNHYIVYFGMDAIERDDLLEKENQGHFNNHLRSNHTKTLLKNKFVTKNVTSQPLSPSSIELSDVYAYVSSLQVSVQCWYNIFNPFDSDYDAETKIWLDKNSRMIRIVRNPYDPRRNLRDTGFSALLMFFLQMVLDNEFRVRLLKVIEKYRFLMLFFSMSESMRQRVHFLRSTTLFFNNKISKEELIGVMEKVISTTIKTLTVDHFVNEFSANGYYKWRGIRYFLYEYDMELQCRSKGEHDKLEWNSFNKRQIDYNTVEHIYPQNARSKYWTSRFSKFSAKEKSRLRNSLGNLLPLSKPKNSSLSNNAFPDKVDGKKDPVVGYRYGCYAENEVSKFPNWSADEILDRGINLLNFMEKRWGLNLGNRKQKINILGLSFLNKDI